MYQWILFDLDGTLTDPKEGITKCFQYALQAFGIEENNLESLTRYIGPPLMKSFGDYFDEAGAAAAVAKYRERYTAVGIRENRVYDGIPETLRALKQAGKKLALATSKPQRFAEQVMKQFELDRYFDLMVGAADDKQQKSDVIRSVFEQAGLSREEAAEQAVMVGDRMYDIAGARECGIDSIGVYFGYARENELEEAGATAVVATPEELKNYLLCH